MVMDLLGQSLEDLFNTCERKLSIKTVCMLALQMISRIEYVHLRTFLHRDIKPGNIMIEHQTHKSFLIDLGLTRPENQAVVGALALVQNTEYIDTRIGEVWRNNLIRVFTQVSLLSLALILLIRWVFYEPMRSLVTALRDARSGKSTTTISTPSFSSFSFSSTLSRSFNSVSIDFNAPLICSGGVTKCRDG